MCFASRFYWKHTRFLQWDCFSDFRQQTPQHDVQATHRRIQVLFDDYQSSGCSGLHQLSIARVSFMASQTFSCCNLLTVLPSNKIWTLGEIVSIRSCNHIGEEEWDKSPSESCKNLWNVSDLCRNLMKYRRLSCRSFNQKLHHLN